jgi:hypothetical protein
MPSPLAEQHLADLEHALRQHGWQTTDTMETPGARRWGHSGCWELTRGGCTLLLDFEGGDFDGVVTEPAERAYACHVRGHPHLGVYLKKRSAPTWRHELDTFVASLDDLARG